MYIFWYFSLYTLYWLTVLSSGDPVSRDFSSIYTLKTPVSTKSKEVKRVQNITPATATAAALNLYYGQRLIQPSNSLSVLSIGKKSSQEEDFDDFDDSTSASVANSRKMKYISPPTFNDLQSAPSYQKSNGHQGFFQ